MILAKYIFGYEGLLVMMHMVFIMVNFMRGYHFRMSGM